MHVSRLWENLPIQRQCCDPRASWTCRKSGSIFVHTLRKGIQNDGWTCPVHFHPQDGEAAQVCHVWYEFRPQGTHKTSRGKLACYRETRWEITNMHINFAGDASGEIYTRKVKVSNSLNNHVGARHRGIERWSIPATSASTRTTRWGILLLTRRDIMERHMVATFVEKDFKVTL